MVMEEEFSRANVVSAVENRWGGDVAVNTEAESSSVIQLRLNKMEEHASVSEFTADLMRAMQVVEKDANEVARSLASLLSSLRHSLSQVTGSSVEHMQCYTEVAGHLQESALDAASKGSRFINACLSLNEEMKGMETLAAQLKVLRRTVDNLDYLVSRHFPRP